jgi:hypothetical protein
MPYCLQPSPLVTTCHACDNEAAVKAHKSIHYHARKPARKWAKTEYRTTPDRLHQAMQSRNGDVIDVVHTHSHLEQIKADRSLQKLTTKQTWPTILNPPPVPPMPESCTRSTLHMDHSRKTLVLPLYLRYNNPRGSHSLPSRWKEL